MTAMIKKPILLLALAITFIYSGVSEAALQTVTLPITIDYPLLRKLLVNHAFQENNESATLINEGNGCVYLALSAPQVSEENGRIKLDIQVNARAGTPLGGRCFTPLEWQGHLVLYEQPFLSPDTWQLSFTTVGSRLLGADRQPARITDVLWDLIKPHIWSYISGIRINLMPPVADVKNFLLPLFPEDKQRQAEGMLASMRPGKIEVQAASMHLPILTDVASVYDPDEKQELARLENEELERTVALWEKWDGLLVYLITTLSQNVLTLEEKRILTNVLLDTRYRFVTELSDRTIPHDIVRQQFVSVWQQLSPLFRKHVLGDTKVSKALGYLAFVASADALLVFDRIGPTMGLEISTPGLVRLVGMLHADPALLHYQSEINPDLQKLFQLGPQDTSPNPPEEKKSSSILHRIFEPFGISAAYAAQPLPSFKDIMQWKVPESDVGDYLKRVEEVLVSSSESVIAQGKVPEDNQAMFRNLIPAMAWQESCFRQFVVKGDQLTYLLSYNQSSVGVMQINERVWRGLYEQNRLRWDISYNAIAGSEIAAHYLTKYALRDPEASRTLDDNTLARLVYAMYNGGPSQHGKFLKRLETEKLYDSDLLFWEKYSWVIAGEINKVSKCLIGR